MNETNIRRLDMTALVVFEKLLKQRNMSVVATEMGLTQSAISHAVARLRSVFDDPLFVRKGAGVEPTSRALRLAMPLSDALIAVRDAMHVGREFHPGSAARNFSIAAPDTIVGALAPAMLSVFSSIAPRCQIMFRSVGHVGSAAALIAGEIDLAVGVFPEPPAECVVRWVGHEGFLVASRQDHPRLGGKLDLRTYCELDHMLVSHEHGARGIVDTVLDNLQLHRRISAIMPQMLVAFAAASRSDTIITAPQSACRFAASLYPLDLYPLPIEIPNLTLTLLQHRDSGADPAVTWLSELAIKFLDTQNAEI